MVGFVIGLLVDAAIIGAIVAAMESDEFPGWGSTILCALAIGVVTSVVQIGLAPLSVWLALAASAAAGALVGGIAISAFCGMSVKRAAIAAAIFLACKVAIGLTCVGLAGLAA